MKEILRASIITLYLISLTGIVHASTITVCSSGCNYPGIQEAINASNASDLVQVHSGIYYENVNITKQLTLQGMDTGNGNPVVDARGNGSVFALTADGITLDGFIATNSGSGDAGIKVISDHNIISGNVVVKNSVGIHLESSSYNNITDNNISMNEEGVYIYLSGNNNLTGNTADKNDFEGFFLWYAPHNNIAGNNLSENEFGILMWDSSNNSLTDNNVINNNRGIYLTNSSENTLKENQMSGNSYNFGVLAWDVVAISTSHYSPRVQEDLKTTGHGSAGGDLPLINYIDTSNLVDNKPINYFIGASDIVIDSSSNAGIVYCINCDNITLRDLTLANNYAGVFFYNTGNSDIKGNYLGNNDWYGTVILSAANNTVLRNNASHNGWEGMLVSDSENCSIINNRITGNHWNGMNIQFSSNNTLGGNNISNNYRGLNLFESNNNTITVNTILNNLYEGTLLEESINNKIYYNTFASNFPNALDLSSGNTWDNGYPAGGNNWSDYSGIDEKSGIDQNQRGSDGIGDSPYSLDVGAMDRYPLMEPWDHFPPEITITWPANNSFLNTPDIIITGNVSDKSGIMCSFFEHRWGTGGAGGGGCGGGNVYPLVIPINRAVTLFEGWNQLVLHYTDVLGNDGSAVINVTLDTISPLLTNISLSTSVPAISHNVNITANVQDENLGDSPIFISITSPGGVTEISPMIGNGEYYYNFTNTSEYGRYDLVISATDLAGNSNVQTEWFITSKPPYINDSINTTRNNITMINALDEANTTLGLVTSENITDGKIDMFMSNEIPPHLNQSFGIEALGMYISINLSDDLTDNLAWALIRVYYTQAELESSGLDEDSLVIRYYDGTSGIWEAIDPSGVDPADVGGYSGHVWANVSNFSNFGIGGELVQQVHSINNGGGGSGGGGGTSGEAFLNIAVTETEREQVNKNSMVSFRFDSEGNIVNYINFTGLSNSGKISAKVEILKNTSALVELPPPDIVYRNLNIWVGNAGWATSRNIAGPVINFRVEKAWVLEHNIDEVSITMNRYSNGEWGRLDTKWFGADGSYLYFEAETPGFSPFAVTGRQMEISVFAGGEGIVVEEPTIEETTVEEEAERDIPGFNLLIGIFSLLIVMKIFGGK